MKSLPLAHPIAIAAVALLVVNDHVLKHAYPGFVTGKLSDVAGMIFFPLLLASFVRGRRALVLACAATAIVFSLTKTMPWANDLYRFTWGAMQWPLRAARAWLEHREAPGIARVVLVRDPSDLLAVPFVLVAWRIGRQIARFGGALEKNATHRMTISMSAPAPAPRLQHQKTARQ